MSGGTVFYYQASAVGADGTESAPSGEAIPPVTTGHWLHCDKDGNPIGDDSASPFRMTGPLTGSANVTGVDALLKQPFDPNYPDPFGDYVSPDPVDSLTCWLFGIGAAPQNSAGFNAYAAAHSYAPFMDGDPTTHCSSDVTIDGALHTYFKWKSDPYVDGQSPAPAPDHMDVLVTTSLYTSGWAGAWNIATNPNWLDLPANGKASASASDDEFGESVSIYADPAGAYIPIHNSSHLGYHLKRVSTSGGVATVTLTGHTIAHADGGDPVSCGTSSEMAWGRAGVDAYAQQDSRSVTLHRDGAHDETVDPDGTVHGDTVYSYTNTYWSEYPEGENTDNVDNWQYFHPQFSGDWTVVIPPVDYPYNISYQWNPSESSDTWDTGKWKMPYGSLNMYSGYWVGKPTGASPPSPMTYTVTDKGDGATATATYILTVHDPYEKYIDNPPTPSRENLQRRGSLSFTATQAAPTGTSYYEQDQTWSVSISAAGAVGEWFATTLGLNLQASYSYTVAQGASVNLGPYKPGYGSWAETYDEYKTYTGTAKTYDAGGYCGTHDYKVKVPTGHGIQAHSPEVWMGPVM